MMPAAPGSEAIEDSSKSIQDLPKEVLMQVLLKVDSLADMGSLSSTCRFLLGMTSDHLMLAHWLKQHMRADDAVFLAARKGWTDVIFTLIERCGLPCHERYQGLDTNGFMESTQEYFGPNRLPIGAHFPSGLSVLEIAAKYDHPRLVAYCLNRPEVRADPDAPVGALFLAAEFDNVECLSNLLSPSSPVDANSRGDTVSNTSALHKAAGKGSLGAVRMLLSQGAQVCVQDDMAKLPLSLACQSSNRPDERAEIVRLLLSAHASSGAIPFQQAIDWVSNDLYPLTPLHWAANSGLHNCCEVLLNAGSQARDMRTLETFPRVSNAKERNRTPLDLCMLRLQDASLAAEESVADFAPGSMAAQLAAMSPPSTCFPATRGDRSALVATMHVLQQWTNQG